MFRSASLVVAFLLLPCIVAAAPEDAEVRTFAWAGGADVEGPGVYKVVVDVGTDNVCELFVEGSADSVSGFLLWVRLGGSWIMFGSQDMNQVHVNELGFDTRSGTSGSEASLRLTESGTVSGIWEMAVMSPNLDVSRIHEPEPRYPARFDVSCRDPIAIVGLYGSRQVISFTDATMQGTGASTHTQVGHLAASAGDHAGRAFTTDEVEVSIFQGTSMGAGAYTWTLTAGDETLDETAPIATPGFQFAQFVHVGGPGAYDFTLTRAVAAQGSILFGWMVGKSEVESLDDV